MESIEVTPEKGLTKEEAELLEKELTKEGERKEHETTEEIARRLAEELERKD